MNLYEVEVTVDDYSSQGEGWSVSVDWAWHDEHRNAIEQLSKQEEAQLCRGRAAIIARVYAALAVEQMVALYKKTRQAPNEHVVALSDDYNGETALIGVCITIWGENGFKKPDASLYWDAGLPPTVSAHRLSKDQAKTVEAAVIRVVKRVLAL